MLSLCLLAPLMLLAAPQSGVDDGAPWELEETDGDLKLESRRVKDSSWLEYRVTTTADLPGELLCDTAFEQATKGKGGPNVKLRKLLKDGEDSRVLYDQVDAPMVSVRDYAMTVRRERGDGSCRIRFKITNEEAPALESGVVRMEHMRGGWDFVPRDGKTQVTYFLYADPGGAVPAFIARGSQKRALKDALSKAIAIAREAKGSKAQ